jgi:hypothetical protein
MADKDAVLRATKELRTESSSAGCQEVAIRLRHVLKWKRAPSFWRRAADAHYLGDQSAGMGLPYSGVYQRSGRELTLLTSVCWT